MHLNNVSLYREDQDNMVHNFGSLGTSQQNRNIKMLHQIGRTPLAIIEILHPIKWKYENME